MLLVWIALGSAILFFVQRSIYSKYWDQKLRIDFQFSENAVNEGEAAGILERSVNRKILPLASYEYQYVVKRNYSASQKKIDRNNMMLRRKLALPARRAVTNRAKLNGLTRGVYTVSEVKLSAWDLFHSLHMERTTDCFTTMTVYPAKIPVQKLSLPVRMMLGSITTRRMAQEDPFALKAIRPYEIYDSPRLINWKASARTGELKVNQFEYSTDEALLFLLDMGNGSEADKEEMLRLASSLSQLFLRRGVGVSLLANVRNCISGLPIRVRFGANPEHRFTVDSALAQINLETPETESFRSFLAAVPTEALRGALPVAISADPSGEALRAFQETPGTKGGYFLSVNGQGRTSNADGVHLLNWNAEEKEVRL